MSSARRACQSLNFIRLPLKQACFFKWPAWSCAAVSKVPKGKTLGEIEADEGGTVKESLVGMAQTKRAAQRKQAHIDGMQPSLSNSPYKSCVCFILCWTSGVCSADCLSFLPRLRGSLSKKCSVALAERTTAAAQRALAVQ